MMNNKVVLFVSLDSQVTLNYYKVHCEKCCLLSIPCSNKINPSRNQ